MVSSRMAWDCGVADLAAGCCSGGRMPNAGARRALRSLAGASWSCRTDPLSRRPSSSIGNRLRKCVGKLAGAPKGGTEHEDGDEERLARTRQRERERKRWCSWTCSSTTAADDGCTRRTTASSELGARKTRRREREAERYWALRFAELRPDARRQREKQKEAHRPKDRPTIACLGC